MPQSARADETLRSQLESILLVGGAVSLASLALATDRPRADIRAALSDLQQTLRGGIRLQLHRDEAQLVTAPENVEAVHRFLGAAKPAPLSRAALETLAVVAYRQPVTRSEIEAVRGVNSDRALQTLLARDLVEELGQRDALGRPMQFGTSFGFLEYFGLSSLDELPPLPEDTHGALEAGVIGLRSASMFPEGNENQGTGFDPVP